MARTALFELRTSQCEYRKAQKTLIVSSELTPGFPERVRVTSDVTGRTVDFVVDVEAGIAAEFWDGEMCEYKPVEPMDRVICLVISHFV
jgi:hypothetical protein